MREILHVWRDVLHWYGRFYMLGGMFCIDAALREVVHAWRESLRYSAQAWDSGSMRESWQPWLRVRIRIILGLGLGLVKLGLGLVRFQSPPSSYYITAANKDFRQWPINAELSTCHDTVHQICLHNSSACSEIIAWTRNLLLHFSCG